MANEVATIPNGAVVQNAVEDLYQQIDRLGGRAGILSTIPMESLEERMNVLKAVSNSDNLSEILGQPLKVKDIVIQAVQMTNEQTGEVQDVPRVILVDKEGAAHHAISAPLFRDVRTLLGIAGDPDGWGDEGIELRVVQEGQKSRQYYTIKY